MEKFVVADNETFYIYKKNHLYVRLGSFDTLIYFQFCLIQL